MHSFRQIVHSNLVDFFEYDSFYIFRIYCGFHFPPISMKKKIFSIFLCFVQLKQSHISHFLFVQYVHMFSQY